MKKKKIKDSAPVTSLEKISVPKQNFKFQQNFVGALAEEIAKTVVERLPRMLPNVKNTRVSDDKDKQRIEHGIFLDTSAIIDGRVFDLAHMGLFTGTFVIFEPILFELKRIADLPDPMRKQRGKKGLSSLEQLRKDKNLKTQILSADKAKDGSKKEVDDQLIDVTRLHKGKVITCDFNLEKKASILGVTAINMNAVAQSMKITAIPGEALTIKIVHPGKDFTQGVGYLEDGTMLVVEDGSDYVGKMIDVLVIRVIQTASGRILFARKV